MRTSHTSLLLSVLLCLLPGSAFAYANPGVPTDYVSDFAGMLRPDTVATLNAELKAFEASTSNQIAVAIVPDLGGDTVENFAVKLFQDWGIGTKDKDNGVLLLISRDDHKLRIEVGYGLEGALPDATSHQIIQNDITPLFKAGEYDAGVQKGVESIIAATQNEYVGTGTTDEVPKWVSSIFENFTWVFILIIFVLQWVGAVLARSKSWWLGGILGAGFGIGILFIFSLSLIIGGILTAILAGLGLLFDYIVSSSFLKSKTSGHTPPWWMGGPPTGGWGGSSGGGFGGFSGGSSGGGGASGGW